MLKIFKKKVLPQQNESIFRSAVAKSPAFIKSQNQKVIMSTKTMNPKLNQKLQTGVVNIIHAVAMKAIAEMQEDGLLDVDALQRMISYGGQTLGFVKEAIKEILVEMEENSAMRLSPIFGLQNLILDATDGTETFIKSRRLFDKYFDDDFISMGLDVPSHPTDIAKVSVYEMIEGGTFRQILESLSFDLDILCLTQGQILVFLKNHWSHLRTHDERNVFLFKRGEDFFIAFVDMEDDGSMGIDFIDLFMAIKYWSLDEAFNVIVPQLDTLPA